MPGFPIKTTLRGAKSNFTFLDLLLSEGIPQTWNGHYYWWKQACVRHDNTDSSRHMRGWGNGLLAKHQQESYRGEQLLCSINSSVLSEHPPPHTHTHNFPAPLRCCFRWLPESLTHTLPQQTPAPTVSQAHKTGAFPRVLWSLKWEYCLSGVCFPLNKITMTIMGSKCLW